MYIYIYIKLYNYYYYYLKKKNKINNLTQLVAVVNPVVIFFRLYNREKPYPQRIEYLQNCKLQNLQNCKPLGVVVGRFKPTTYSVVYLLTPRVNLIM